MKICNQATILLVHVHLLSSPFVTDDLAVLPPLPPCHNWVGCVVGSPPARHKKSTQVKHVTKICHTLAQHSSTRQSCPSPDIQWPPPLYLIRTLPRGGGCCWKSEHHVSPTSWLTLLMDLSKEFHSGLKSPPRSGSAHSF